MKNSTQSTAQLLITAGCICIGLAMLLVMWYLFQPAPIVRTFVIAGSQLSIAEIATKTQVDYRVGDETSLETKAWRLKSLEGYEAFGVTAQYQYLEKAAYEEVLGIRKKNEVCPAPFINSKTKNLLIVTNDAKMSEEFAGQRFTQGDTLRLRGAVLTFEKGTIDGSPVLGSSSSFSYFLLRSFSRS